MIDLDFNTYPDNIALLFSGGADSSLLYYLMAKKMPNKTLTLFTIDRHNDPVSIAKLIFQKINDKLNYQNGSFNVLPIPLVEQHLEVTLATKILESKFDAVVWGINQYPSDTTIRPVFLFNFIEQGKLRLPLANVSKIEIIKTFYELGIDDILKMTRSCGFNIGFPCKQCFNCRERAWAYKNLNLPVEYGL